MSSTKPTDTVDLVAVTIPLFVIVTFSELVISKLKQQPTYRVNALVNNISCGMMLEMVKIHLKWMVIVPYSYVYTHYAIYRCSMDSTLVSFVVFLGVDFGYYWIHRANHEINLGWVAHGTHHSSEDLNLSTALRQSMWGIPFYFLFYVPLALFFPPYLYTLHYSINMLYQFWIHTEAIGKLHPWFEFFFNTPSHHRVHHGRNPKYIDKNYAGMLIIWDRMFGTFQEEQEKPLYGLIHQLNTWDVIWAQIHHVVYIVHEVNNTSGIGNKLKAIFKVSELETNPPPPVDYKQPKYDPYVSTHLTVYLGLQFLITAVAFCVFLKVHKSWGFFHIITVTFYFIFCLEVYSFCFNRSKYAKYLEVFKILLTLLVGSYYTTYTSFLAIYCVVSLSFIFALDKEWKFKDVPDIQLAGKGTQ